jgi:hypothetical protein
MLLRLRRCAEIIGQIAWGMARGVILAGMRPYGPDCDGRGWVRIGDEDHE